MWSTEQSIETAAPPAAVWAFYEDAGNWDRWAPHIEWSRPDGRFEAGTIVETKFRGERPLRFRIVSVDAGHGFVAEAPAALRLRLRLEPRLEPIGNGTRITHRVVLVGRMSVVAGLLVGGRMRRSMSQAVERLGGLAAEPARKPRLTTRESEREA